MSASYTTADTVWPSVITLDPAIKQLVARFYEIADVPDTRAGDLFVAEVFTSNGAMAGPGGHEVTGESGKANAETPSFRTGYGANKRTSPAEVRKCREYAWTAISARRHRVRRVYATDPAGLDLMLIGEVEMTVRKSGKVVQGEFSARFVVDSESFSRGQPRLASTSIWADSAPLVAALNE